MEGEKKGDIIKKVDRGGSTDSLLTHSKVSQSQLKKVMIVMSFKLYK
jgi:hypothetical protein